MASLVFMNNVFIANLLIMSTSDPIPMKGELAFETVTSDLAWWQKTIMYHIYPRSFQDTGYDGVGDIEGIIYRLEHFKYLEIDAIILGPIYKSPMVDFGYDVSNYTAIDKSYGEMSTFYRLVQKLHKNGIKIILDFIPNHTSNRHPWFIESRKGSKNNPYRDFYVWHDGKVLPNGDRAPPNNWMSLFGGSAWTWDDERRQYYYHQYLSQQPDLNWRNPRVQDEILKALEFWLDHGVDGFRMNAIDKLYEVENLNLDEPSTGRTDIPEIDHRQLNHIYVRNQPELHGRIREWRKFFDNYEEEHNHSHICLLTVMQDPTLTYTMQYYHSGADQPLNLNFMSIGKRTGATKIYTLVQSWLGRMPARKWPNWVLGNQDERRISNKRGEKYVDALNMILLLLPGTPITYQGEEIGMRNIHPSFPDSKDPRGKIFGKFQASDRIEVTKTEVCRRHDVFCDVDDYYEEYVNDDTIDDFIFNKPYFEKYSRDGSRGPMQWSSETHAGFSGGYHTWLPVHGDHKRRNVRKQTRNTVDPTTTLELYRRLSQLRKEPSFQRGEMRYSVVNENIFSFVRYHEEDSPYLVAINIGDRPSTNDYTWELGDITIVRGKIVAIHRERLSLFRSSRPMDWCREISVYFGLSLEYCDDTYIDLSRFLLNPGEAVVIELLK